MNNTEEVGYVISSRSFSIRLEGLPGAKINDMVQSNKGARGWVNSLNDSWVEVLMVDDVKVEPGEEFRKLPNRLSVPVGEFLLGRSINPLGVPIDGKRALTTQKKVESFALERGALGIESRKFIDQQFFTGITLTDTLIPIGRGQRELCIGDAHSGKVQFLIDTIVNQKGSDTICIYASIGQSSVSVRALIDILKANGSMDYTIVIASSSSEPAPLIFLTPKTAFSVAEYFQSKGKNVLLILDDLGSHAKVYREISLLGNRSPGRESYPGDIFYQHAHLLERAGNFLPEFGGGSITALPVIELNMIDFTTLIPTNLMSMTDGHLLFKSSMRSQGQIPSIDIAFSVSRVGRQTQSPLANSLSAKVRLILSEAQDLETISRFSSELPPQTQLILRRRGQIMEMLKQEPLTKIDPPMQLILLALPFTKFFEDKNKDFVEANKQKIINAFLQEKLLTAVTASVARLKTAEELILELEKTAIVLEKVCTSP